MSDPYQDYAAERTPKPRPKREKTPQQKAVDKVRAERDALGKVYRAMRGHHIARVLAAHDQPGNLAPFLETLRELSIEDAAILVEAVRDARWLRNADSELRFLALQEIDAIITRIRENAGLVPFDDPIADSETNAFLQVKGLLRL